MNKMTETIHDKCLHDDKANYRTETYVKHCFTQLKHHRHDHKYKRCVLKYQDLMITKIKGTRKTILA